MQADRQRGEDRGAIAVAAAVERFIDMLEAGLQRYPVTGQQCALRRISRQAFERAQTMLDRELTNGVHPGMEVERRQAHAPIADLGDAQPDLRPDMLE